MDRPVMLTCPSHLIATSSILRHHQEAGLSTRISQTWHTDLAFQDADQRYKMTLSASSPLSTSLHSPAGLAKTCSDADEVDTDETTNLDL